jgi:hypothetical protein
MRSERSITKALLCVRHFHLEPDADLPSLSTNAGLVSRAHGRADGLSADSTLRATADQSVRKPNLGFAGRRPVLDPRSTRKRNGGARRDRGECTSHALTTAASSRRARHQGWLSGSRAPLRPGRELPAARTRAQWISDHPGGSALPGGRCAAAPRTGRLRIFSLEVSGSFPRNQKPARGVSLVSEHTF